MTSQRTTHARRRRTAPVRRLGGAVLAGAMLTGALGNLFGAPPATAQTAGVVARPADALVESIGVNTHLHYSGVYTSFPKVKEALVGAGIRHIRDYPIPSSAAKFRELSASGVQLTAIMGVAAPRSWMPFSLDQLYAVVRDDLRGSIAAFEGVNEWDINGDPNWAANLRTHQQALWNRAKSSPVTSGIPVVAPSLTWASNAPALGDISAWSDFGNMHPYPGGRTPDKRVSEDVAANKLHNVRGKPVMATETGYHTALSTTSGHKPASEAAEGIYMPRLWLRYFDIGVPRTFTYELVDQGTGNHDSEARFGLLRSDFSPKPGYTTTKNLISLLADPGPGFTPGRLDYTLTGGDALTRQVLLQKRDGSFWLALWQETAVWNESTGTTIDPPDRSVTLRLPERSSVRTYSPVIGTHAQSSATGLTSLDLTASERVTLVEVRPGGTATAAPAPGPVTTAPAAPAPAPAPAAPAPAAGPAPAGVTGAAGSCGGGTSAAAFSDVTAANVHSAAISCLASRGIAFGRGGAYEPAGTVTRGQMASFVVRALEGTSVVLPPEGSVTFPDVAGSVHRAAIQRLAAAGVLSGRVDGTFGPEEAMSRAQIAAVAVRAHQLATGVTRPATGDHFADDDGSPHEPLIDRAADLGLVSGVGNRQFRPGVLVQRDQVASVLVRLLAALDQAP